MAFSTNSLEFALLLFVSLILASYLDLGTAHQCQGDHHHHHHHDHDHAHSHSHLHQDKEEFVVRSKLPEELAEEEDMKLYGFGLPHDYHHHHDHHHFIESTELSGLGLWLNALGCSFLVSMASLICLITLPVIFAQGKPSKAVVDSLALFGAGAMLGDAFLHQLPHAFGGEHSHSHDNHADHHDHDADSGHGHAHSLADLSTGISILAGIVLFLLVEKLVRYVEENSRGANSWTHGHHHHSHNSINKLKDDKDSDVNTQTQSPNAKKERLLAEAEGKDDNGFLKGDNPTKSESSLRKRTGSNATKGDNPSDKAVDSSADDIKSSNTREPVRPPSSLVFGYLNLFSDGVHNFTDGMALGSAFLLYGSVGGWSRTLFLLAHELPQEIGDFGILIRSGFSIPKALLFNFLSALVALAGTALALLLGKDPGQSSLIEGFTAGGFIYIAIAGVLAEMNNSGSTTLRSTAIHIISLTMGMAVALGISLVE